MSEPKKHLGASYTAVRRLGMSYCALRVMSSENCFASFANKRRENVGFFKTNKGNSLIIEYERQL